ncbi:methylated-DNA--[protein]-cysteine S-methyltransferase [Sphingobium sp. EM0848]|uniref:methylated-DNA--[protein]-cysteine S-methyltransferase n=1 Tax=Sphingobium sp. EM0848 TaxID=2743473 RepID=UPI00159C9C1E|nr:methylated-DNA--[protein]-cysteine S-methyltransferase [Sphingobium sp. EM0848]
MNIMVSDRVPDARAAMKAGEPIAYSTASSAFGLLLVARSAAGVCSIQIGEDRQTLEAELVAAFPNARLVMDHGAVSEDIGKVMRFIETPAAGLNLKLDMRGTPFQRKVWDMLRTIPAGVTVSYNELAERLGEPGAARAVASACAANKLALAVPCHRVVRSDGNLAGFRWGIERKRHLLDREVAA